MKVTEEWKGEVEEIFPKRNGPTHHNHLQHNKEFS